MQHLHAKSILPYTITELFDLVIDIESYPEFLPWVSDAIIIHRESGKMIADLTANFAGLKKSYRSDITYMMLERNAYIEAESHTGPFKFLKTKWSFHPDYSENISSSNSEHVILPTLIDFTLEFELKSKLMTNLISSVIMKTQKQMMDAFENRAKEKYDKKS